MKKGITTKPVSLITLADKNSPISEQYRTLRSNIQFASIDNDLKTMVVTSSGPGEGKSTTSANLAVVMANSNKRVLLIDADLRKPTVALTFKLPNNNGLSTLIGNRNFKIADVVQDSGIQNLSIMTSGPKPPNPSEILGSNRMKTIINEASLEYDLVIFDMPPVATVTDAQIISAEVDGTLLVVRERTTNKQALNRAVGLLKMAKAHIIGIAYNGVKRHGSDSYYYYYG